MTEALDKLIAAVEAGSWDGSWRWLLDNIWDINHCQPFSDAYHGSLDSAVALKDALLPGWEWGRLVSHGTMVVATREGPYQSFSDGSANPARALLLATLRAVKGDRDD